MLARTTRKLYEHRPTGELSRYITFPLQGHTCAQPGHEKASIVIGSTLEWSCEIYVFLFRADVTMIVIHSQNRVQSELAYIKR